MVQVVTDADGTKHEFPDDASPAEMQAALSGPANFGDVTGGSSSTDLSPGPGLVDRIRGMARSALQYKPPPIIGEPLAGMAGVPFAKSGEDILDAMPGTAGAVAGVLTGGPGAIPGAAAGEVARQGIRGAVGLPPGTGIVQHFTGQDPNSPGAMATGVAAETLGAAAIKPLQGALGWIFKSNPAERAAIREAAATAEKHGIDPALSNVVAGTRFEPAARAAQLIGESGVVGHGISETASRASIEKGLGSMEGIASNLRQTPLGATKQMGAEMAQEGLQAGYSAAKNEEKAAFEAWRAAFGDRPVPKVGETLLKSVGDALELAPQDRWKLLTSLKVPASQLRAELPLSGKPSAFKDLMGRVITLSTKGDKVPAEEVRLLVSALREEARGQTGLTRRLYTQVAQSADDLLAQTHPDAAAALEEAKKLTYALKETFGQLRGGTGNPLKGSLSTQIPESIPGKLKSGSAGDLFDSALKYAEKQGGGTAGREALVSAKLESLLPPGRRPTPQAIRGVDGALDQAAEALRPVAANSPAAQQAIQEFGKLAKLFRGVQQTSNIKTSLMIGIPRSSLALLTGFTLGGPTGAIGAEAGMEGLMAGLAKMSYSPAARKFLISGMEAANRGEISAAIRAFQQASSIAIAEGHAAIDRDERKQALGPMAP